MKKYAVIVYYTFDIGHSEVYLFDTYEQACEYLTSMWNYCFNFGLEDKYFNKEESYCEKDYAELRWNDSDKRIFEVANVIKPMKFE